MRKGGLAEPLPDAAKQALGGQRPLRAAPSFIASAIWLGAALALPKVILLPPSEKGWNGWGLDLLVATHRDYQFVLWATLAAWAVWALAWWRPQLRRLIWCVWLMFCMLCIVYSAISFWIYRAVQSPLTYYVFYDAGNMRNMRSSIAAIASTSTWISLLAAPLLYLLALRMTEKVRSRIATGAPGPLIASRTRITGSSPRHRLWHAFFRATFIVLVLAYVQFGSLAYDATWSYRIDHALADNPHWALLESSAIELIGISAGPERSKLRAHAPRSARPELLPPTFPPEDLTDFQTLSEQRAATQPSAPLPAPIALPAGPRPRNVIWVVLESVGAPWLSVYGSPYKTTPHLEAEASSSLILDHFYADIGRTDGTLATLARSQYVPITWQRLAEENPSVPGTSLADVLRRRGYRTAFMSSADLTYVDMKSFLAHRGFDEVGGMLDNMPRNAVNSWGGSDRMLIDQILPWVDRKPNSPFFAMVWTTQTHHPFTLSRNRTPLPLYTGPSTFRTAGLNGYLNSLLEADELLGRLFDALRSRGIADDTLVVITGDHGEAFGLLHPTVGHGWHVYEENVSVPCIFWNPRLFAPGHRSHAVGAHIDLSLSILDLLGVDASAAPADWQGHSLFAPGHPGRAYFFAANADLILGVRDGDWKYSLNLTANYEELYDLHSDPTEVRNLAESEIVRCRRLRDRLAAWLAYEQRHYREFYEHWNCFGPPSWAR